MSGVAPPERHGRIALDAAVAIVLRAFPDFGAGLPTDDVRSAARERVRAIARLAEQSLYDELWAAAVAVRA